VVLYDTKFKRWKKLAEGIGFENLYWSHSGTDLYVQDFQRGNEQPIVDISIANHRVRTIVSKDDLPRSDVRSFSLTGITPSGSLLLSVVTAKVDVYELDIDLR
jgi:hypothetical protein